MTSYLLDMSKCCKRYRESKDSFSSNVQLTIELIQKSALNVDEAKDIFRSKRYFNLKERQYAENIFRNALYIINHVSYGVKYTFNSIDLPYDYYSTPEIMKSLADTLHNPFISFYETAFLKRIQREKNRVYWDFGERLFPIDFCSYVSETD